MAETHEGTLFKAEYELELERWLRKRYAWFLGCLIGLYLLELILSATTMLTMHASSTAKEAVETATKGGSERIQTYTTLAFFTTILVLSVAARAFLVVRTRLETREQTLRAASWFIVQVGLINLVSDAGRAFLLQSPNVGASELSVIFTLHLVASLFLPWTPRESWRPMYPLLALYVGQLVLYKLFLQMDEFLIVGYLVLTPLALAPGSIVAWYRLRKRRRQFNREMVTKGFFSMRRELNQARAVQLALFPKPILSDHLHFDFAYVPANEVGGDFVHASIDEKGRLDVVLLDVTGHGLTGALTVSRLSGEIERLLAEDPDIQPGHVLRMLNRYVNLTLSRHSIYATAMCIQVCPKTGAVHYANAGHPPAFVRRGDGTVEQFDSTTWLLGAAPDSMFEDDQLEFTLGPQDTLVLVTDGVHEAPNKRGERFGLARLTQSLGRTPQPERWAQHIATAASSWRGGVGDDDILVASVRVPTAAPAAPRPRPRAVDIEDETTFQPSAAYPSQPAKQPSDSGTPA